MSAAGESTKESAAWFVVIANGAEAKACVVAGLDGVREALIPIVLAGRADLAPDSLAGMLSAIEDPSLWAAHGSGDGHPYWHLWVPLESGSVSVQRLTAPPPMDPEAARRQTDALRRSLLEVHDALLALSRDLNSQRRSGITI